MKFERLSVYTHYKGGFQMTVEFKGETGKIELKLPPELHQRILAVCADEMTSAVARASAEMTARIVNQAAKQLPAE